MEKPLDEWVELQDSQTEVVPLRENQIGEIHGVRVGKIIVVVKETGHILVDYPDNPFDPLPARSTVNITSDEAHRAVLLTFERNDPRLPIIIGWIQDEPVVTLDKKEIEDVIVDGERIVFEAEKEIELRCGQSTLIIKRDKVVIKSPQIVSRAGGVNKIKGAAVQIN